MFLLNHVEGVITKILEEHTGDDYCDDYTEICVIFTSGQMVRAHVPVVGINISLNDGIRGLGYYSYGVSDSYGMPEITQIFFFTDCEFFQASEEWIKKEAV